MVDPLRYLQLADRTVDLAVGTVTGPDVSVQLTRRECQLLTALCTPPNQTMGRLELLQCVWGRNDPDDRVLDTTVSRLRLKLEPAPRKPTTLLTDYGIGYRLQLALPAMDGSRRPVLLGHQQHVDTLTEALHQGRSACIVGAIGSGKSRVAADACSVWSAQPNRRLCRFDYVEPVGPDAIADSLNRVPPSETRTVILLDNVVPTQPIAATLGSWLAVNPNAMVVITGPIAIQGLQTIQVTPLEQAEAIQFSLRLSAQTGLDLMTAEQLQALFEWVGTSPGILQLVLAQLDMLEMDELLLLLGRGDLDVLDLPSPSSQALRGRIAAIASVLSEDERLVASALSLFRDGFTDHVASELCARLFPTIPPTLWLPRLRAFHLLRTTHRAGGLRHQLIPIAHAYFKRTTQRHPNRDRLMRQHAELVLELTEGLEREVREVGSAGALPRLLLERANLVAILDRDLDDRTSTRAANVLYPLTRANDTKSLRERVLREQIAESSPEDGTRVEFLMNRGRILYFAGQETQAFATWRKALAACRLPAERHLLWRMSGAVAAAEAQYGAPWSATDLSPYITAAREEGAWDICANLLITHSEQRLCRGDLNVMPHLNEALQLCERSGNQLRKYIATLSIARRWHALSEPEARMWFGRSHQLATELGLPLVQAELAIDSAMFDLVCGNPANAASQLNTRHDYLNQASDYFQWQVLNARAVVALVQNDPQGALDTLDTVRATAKGGSLSVANALVILAHADLERLDMAEMWFRIRPSRARSVRGHHAYHEAGRILRLEQLSRRAQQRPGEAIQHIDSLKPLTQPRPATRFPMVTVLRRLTDAKANRLLNRLLNGR